jgi:hypothetical protein
MAANRCCSSQVADEELDIAAGSSVAPTGLAVLAGYCGHLPLAVHAAAARPALAATAVVADLAAACSRLTALDTPALEISVTASLDASYRALDAGTARAYRLLATCPGHEQTSRSNWVGHTEKDLHSRTSPRGLPS